MDKLLAVASFTLAVVIVFTTTANGSVAILVVTFLAVPALFLIRKYIPQDKEFVTRIFIIALLARLLFGLLIHLLDMHETFAGDAVTYDDFGYFLTQTWQGVDLDPMLERAVQIRMNGVGWGMYYLVAILYSIFGKNLLAAQSFCAVFGAAIAPLIYICSYNIFNNRRVAQTAAVLVALYPAFIIWTGQLLKDGLIVFLLVLVMIVLHNLRQKFSYTNLVILILSLFAVISLRFYIFYMLVFAIVGAFMVGIGNSSQNVFKRLVVLMLLAAGLTYLGVTRYANAEFEKFGSLEKIQISRQDAATRGESGFGQDLDVATVDGAAAAIPIGLAYVLLAPFPWQITNFRQALTLPDMLIWWCSIPFMISGLYYSLKNRLKGAFAILIFLAALTLGYSLFQGNVGTAYRQRTQIQVFLFIFVGVGWTIYKEKKENEKALRMLRARENEKFWRRNYQNNQIADSDELDKPVPDEGRLPAPPVLPAVPQDTGAGMTNEQAESAPVLQKEAVAEPEKSDQGQPKVFRATKKQIAKAQKLLLEQGFYQGTSTGKYNNKFRKAIKKYQGQQELKKTGTLNKFTLQKLDIKLTKKQKRWTR